ncbi:Na(+)-translocating NADH-quinone reductase subunit C [Lentisphaera araneosa HTCC2155]|uniref:Na(+)-translocating NADH-quinone reductase subunit C n=1 Tax=Lentisphaera araneosa HTCC2155 TaxID=313628 RepID=A6DRQ2_9BACT|nr:NADH:ubiquinone reductase (Na(+)-transporting) subunit C [Lentisphaera araneosa]EDM25721.1 Na(+)-translocating NADH-quinone reductase subunit C [Lentisphaera araneosa HTCC2155]
MQESNVKTMTFATIVTVVCAVILGATATALKPQQELNAKVFKLKNIVQVFGLAAENDKDVEEYFSEAGKDDKFIVRIIKDADGNEVEMNEIEFKNLDLYKQEKEPVASRRYPYFLKFDSAADKAADKPSAIVLPTQDFGLWSVCYGYLSLESDAETIKGIVYYDHKETPGLGAEIEQEFWKVSFEGKKIIDNNGALLAPKASKDAAIAKDSPNHYISVSGATFTMDGIDKGLVKTLKNYEKVIEHYRGGNK